MPDSDQLQRDHLLAVQAREERERTLALQREVIGQIERQITHAEQKEAEALAALRACVEAEEAAKVGRAPVEEPVEAAENEGLAPTRDEVHERAGASRGAAPVPRYPNYDQGGLGDA
jgi:hypothetical protein